MDSKEQRATQRHMLQQADPSLEGTSGCQPEADRLLIISQLQNMADQPLVEKSGIKGDFAFY